METLVTLLSAYGGRWLYWVYGSGRPDSVHPHHGELTSEGLLFLSIVGANWVDRTKDGIASHDDALVVGSWRIFQRSTDAYAGYGE